MAVQHSITSSRLASAYAERVINNRFFEGDRYYILQRSRYLRTMKELASHRVNEDTRLLEIGGGQIALMAQDLWRCNAVVADVGNEYSESITRFGVEHTVCDLVRDDPPWHEEFDVVVMCEVVEHLPIPPHMVFEKILRWLKPGGFIFLTTPNLYRLRNSVRLLFGMPVFCVFRYPEPGCSIGHPIEYDREHLRWHLSAAGFESIKMKLMQMSNRGFTPAAVAARLLMKPFYLRPLWRDGIVATARRPNR